MGTRDADPWGGRNPEGDPGFQAKIGDYVEWRFHQDVIAALEAEPVAAVIHTVDLSTGALSDPGRALCVVCVREVVDASSASAVPACGWCRAVDRETAHPRTGGTTLSLDLSRAAVVYGGARLPFSPGRVAGQVKTMAEASGWAGAATVPLKTWQREFPPSEAASRAAYQELAAEVTRRRSSRCRWGLRRRAVAGD